MKIDELIAEYEQKAGKELTPQVRDLCVALMEMCYQVKAAGIKDATDGRPPRKKEYFVDWAKEGMGDKYHDDDHAIAILLYLYYSDGYSSQKGA